MATLSPKTLGLRLEYLHGLPHLIHCSLKYPATTKGEQGVTRKGQIIVFEIPGDMAKCVAWCCNDFSLVTGKLINATRAHGFGEAWQFIGFCTVANNGAIPFGLQFQHSTNMIMMVVCQENVRQRPSALS